MKYLITFFAGLMLGVTLMAILYVGRNNWDE